VRFEGGVRWREEAVVSVEKAAADQVADSVPNRVLLSERGLIAGEFSNELVEGQLEGVASEDKIEDGLLELSVLIDEVTGPCVGAHQRK
jgi:hypothetical protein